jgi:hypothetical protein
LLEGVWFKDNKDIITTSLEMIQKESGGISMKRLRRRLIKVFISYKLFHVQNSQVKAKQMG